MVNNSAANGWRVQKFGGTSVGKFPDKVRDSVGVSRAFVGDVVGCVG
jgi:aspartokinase